jgi:hypothetical protein
MGKQLACAYSWYWHSCSEAYFEKTVLLKHVQHVPSIRKNLVSGSMLCRDGYKIVLESNKCVVSKHGIFIGKGYDCEGLFHLSLLDVCNKVVNTVDISNESDLWHSRLYHVNLAVSCD